MDININTFDILDLARYKHGNYLVVKNQEIDFLNLAMSDLEAREKGMKAALDSFPNLMRKEYGKKQNTI